MTLVDDFLNYIRKKTISDPSPDKTVAVVETTTVIKHNAKKSLSKRCGAIELRQAGNPIL